MTQEIVDIVDHNNNVIGQKDRDVALENHHFRGVHIWIINDKHEVLMAKRPLDKKIFPGCYTSSAGGHLDAGEDYATAASRELKEELGIDVPLTFACSFVWHRSIHQMVFHQLFIGKHTGDVKIDASEIVSVAWVPYENLCIEASQSPDRFSEAFLEALHAHERTKGTGRTMIVFDLDNTLCDTTQLAESYDPEDLAKLTLLPGASELLSVPDCVKVLITKNKGEDPERQNKKLDVLGITGRFNDVHVVREDSEKLQWLEAAMKKYRVRPADVVVIGDRPDAEIRCGNVLGCTTIQIKHGKYKNQHPADHLEVSTHVIESLHQAIPIIDNLIKNAKARTVL